MPTMTRCLLASLLLAYALPALLLADDTAATSRKVYGEWKIGIKPDQGAAYGRLIEKEGLPLFREAGGRMVGWWTTLVGNLYEHVTIWEYDDLAAFERAVGFLGSSDRFAKFVAQRDPLLSGESSRFVRLASGAVEPLLAEPAKFVVHETHAVAPDKQTAYLDWLRKDGMPILEKAGFHPVGPWVSVLGKSSEVTLLFRFGSLKEREEAVATFQSSADGQRYQRRLAEAGVTAESRLLLPASFAKATSKSAGAATVAPPAYVRQAASKLLPHLEQVAPGVFAAGFANRHRDANCGFLAGSSGAILIDLPRGIDVANYYKEVARLVGQPPRTLLLTRADKADLPTVERLVALGVERVFITRAGRQALAPVDKSALDVALQTCDDETNVGDGAAIVRYLPADRTATAACASVLIPAAGVLFAGPLVQHGPRAPLAGSNTAAWMEQLQTLETLGTQRVVPGHGSWVGHDHLARQREFLHELRSQIAHAVALGKPAEALEKHVRISPAFQVWMPYDTPIGEDFLHVYRELTVPLAPFSGQQLDPQSPQPHALVLIGDGPHEPTHLEEGLRPTLLAAGITPHFTVDTRALTADNLAQVKLLVILRDGLARPSDDPKSFHTWVTPDHEQAVVDFVRRGGGFLNLHNSLGIYPDDGPYLKLVAGRYNSHGPLERFRVEVVPGEHPITRGVTPFSVADEQHTPLVDHSRVTLLLRSRADDGTVGSAGWVTQLDAGRVCHLACGHTREALAHSEYQKLLRNAALWCLGKESR